MNSTEFISLLKTSSSLTREQMTALGKLINTFPYFQSARCLHLKSLKEQDSFLYNQELKKTAAYTTDRSVLFDFITALQPNTKHLESAQQHTSVIIPDEIEVTTETIVPETNADTISTAENTTTTDHKTEHTTTETLEITLGVHQPLDFKANEVHSFSEWLQITRLHPIQRERLNENQDTSQKKGAKKTPEQKQQLNLIDKFIAENPKIPPVSKNTKPRNLAKEVPAVPEELMTETLAKVYLAQKKYKKAIQAYKILILKNPKKSGFFADQIRTIQQLKDNK